MKEHLMTPDDLVDVTGRKRYSVQANWFRHQFGIYVTQRKNGSVVMTWEVFRELQMGRAGIASTGEPVSEAV